MLTGKQIKIKRKFLSHTLHYLLKLQTCILSDPVDKTNILSWNVGCIYWYSESYNQFNLFSPVDQDRYCANSVDPNKTLITSLCKIYSVCRSVFQTEMKPLFASVDMSKYKDRRIHFRNSGRKGLKKYNQLKEVLLENVLILCKHFMTDDGETPDRLCSITGSPDSVQKAQQMIEELLQNSNVSQSNLYTL